MYTLYSVIWHLLSNITSTETRRSKIMSHNTKNTGLCNSTPACLYHNIFEHNPCIVIPIYLYHFRLNWHRVHSHARSFKLIQWHMIWNGHLEYLLKVNVHVLRDGRFLSVQYEMYWQITLHDIYFSLARSSNCMRNFTYVKTVYLQWTFTYWQTTKQNQMSLCCEKQREWINLLYLPTYSFNWLQICITFTQLFLTVPA